MPSGNQYQGTTGQGEPSSMAHYPTPGTRLLGTIGTGPIRGIRQCTTGGVYVVSGDSLYSVDTSAWTGTPLGDLTHGLVTPVSMSDNGLDMLVVDGTANGWDVTLAANTMAAIPTADGAFSGADRVDYLDTFFLFNKPNTPQFYISGSLAVTFDPLDFANKESYSDLLVTILVAGRLVYLLGEKTTEVWYNAGATDIGAGSFPFAALQSYVIVDHGCAAKYSPAVFDSSMFWLTRNRQGQGFVLQVSETKTKRISTYAIEAELAGYERIDDAIGFCYQLAGHAFYVLTFPHADKTWCYEPATGHWHEWAWIDTNGAEHRHRANCFWPINDLLVVGDWQNGNLYALDNRVFTDNGQPIKRVRTFPHMLNDGKRVFYRQFLADMETGWTPQLSATTTTVQQILTWLPEIAQLTGPPTNTDTVPAPDWQRGVVYFADDTSYSSWSIALATQTAPIASSTHTTQLFGSFTVDPLSGDLLKQPIAGNGSPILKLNPNTFATIGTFGVSTSAPSYPTSVWYGERLVCVVCNGVSYGFLKESAFSGNVAAFRVDTMQHAGFYQPVVSGSVNNRGTICAGASGGSAASVFASWNSITSPTPSVPLYVINVTSGAETYNPATWPATNPHITWATVGTIAASAVDPTWSHLACYSLGCDLADGNVLMWVQTNDAVVHQQYIIKARATNAAVMWAIPVSSTTRMALETSRINGSLWVFDSSSSEHINTLTGLITQRIFSGTNNNLPGYPTTDSEQSLALYYGLFTSGTDSPLAVAGTGNFSGGWAVMGGQTEVSTAVSAAGVPSNQISLRWSDDRGHTWGSWVTQDIGEAGEYRTSLQWQRLGMARDRNFEISWSVPFHTALQGAWIDVTPAQS